MTTRHQKIPGCLNSTTEGFTEEIGTVRLQVVHVITL